MTSRDWFSLPPSGVCPLVLNGEHKDEATIALPLLCQLVYPCISLWSRVGLPSRYGDCVIDGSQCLSAVSLLMSNHEFLDVNLLASLLNDTEFVTIIVLLTSHLLWHHLFSEGFFFFLKKENNYSTLFLFQMASIISLLLLQMLYENFRMWANNREMKLMKVSFQLIIHNVEINIFCVSTKCNAECKACIIWSIWFQMACVVSEPLASGHVLVHCFHGEEAGKGQCLICPKD